MRKLLLVSVFALVPLVAFAGGNNLNALGAASIAGVSSTQTTNANSSLKGTGFVVNGAIAGNYTAVNTGGRAAIGDGKATAQTGATQINLGGVVAGAAGQGRITASQGGLQGSTAFGGTLVGGISVGQEGMRHHPTAPAVD